MRPIAVITGSNGFVGSHLVDYLLQKNYIIRCIVRNDSNLRWLAGKDIELFKCGLNDVESLKKVFKDASYIYHIAGTVKAPNREGYYKGNVEPTKKILEAALSADNLKRIIVTSSLAAASPSSPGKPVVEETPSSPLTDYGKSKVEQESVCRSYMDRLPITIIRPPVVFGERDVDVLLFFQTVKRGLLPLIGFDNKTLSLVYVRDLVAGMEKAALSSNAVGQTYFLSYENEFTWKELGGISAKEIGAKTITLRVPHFVIKSAASASEFWARLSKKSTIFNREKAQEIVQKGWACSSEKARKDFDYSPLFPIEEAMKNTIQWYKTEGWL